MDEDEVKRRTRAWLESQGYKVTEEIGVSGTERQVILDFYGYREQQSEPQIIWVECKGDQNLSELLEGWVRLEFGVFYGGGKAILAVPKDAAERLLKHEEFLKGSTIKILNVESHLPQFSQLVLSHLPPAQSLSDETP